MPLSSSPPPPFTSPGPEGIAEDVPAARGADWTRKQLLSYGLMGFPLAFVALPLYVALPHFYASQFGIALGTLGALLLAVRLLDALIDPLLGRWVDVLLMRGNAALMRFCRLAAGILALGFAGLWYPVLRGGTPLLINLAIALCISYTAFSALSIAHQAWGARLRGSEPQRAQIVAWREGLGLAGVIVASVMGALWPIGVTIGVLWLGLWLGLVRWQRGPHPLAGASPVHAVRQPVSIGAPFQRAAFRSLFAVFMLNGIASALPATLLLFFIQDRLQAPASLQAVFLGSYFVSAALSLGLWLSVVKRIGLARTWLAGMVLACAVFIFAMGLGSGDIAAFTVVCALSGVALGSDLVAPSAMLAGVVAQDKKLSEGAFFGWWNFASKLNLALAAGISLPLLSLWGYAPGVRSIEALEALTWGYCLLPCVLKACAAGLLYVLIIRKPL